MAKLVEHRQIVQRRIAPHVVEVAQEGGTSHRNEDRMLTAQTHIVRRVARVICEV
jgi:hypothetical protein